MYFSREILDSSGNYYIRNPKPGENGPTNTHIKHTNQHNDASNVKKKKCECGSCGGVYYARFAGISHGINSEAVCIKCYKKKQQPYPQQSRQQPPPQQSRQQPRQQPRKQPRKQQPGKQQPRKQSRQPLQQPQQQPRQQPRQPLQQQLQQQLQQPQPREQQPIGSNRGFLYTKSGTTSGIVTGAVLGPLHMCSTYECVFKFMSPFSQGCFNIFCYDNI